MKKLLIIFINLILFDKLNSNTKWNGFTLRIQSGLYSDYVKVKDKDGNYKKPTGVDAIFGWGIDYSFIIKGHFYLGFDLGFPYYDKIFKAEKIKENPLIENFSFSTLLLYLTPITYIHIGYAWTDWVLTIGPTYLRGIATTLKRAINHNTSFEFRHTWFFDKFTQNDGLHDMHFLFSLRYTF